MPTQVREALTALGASPFVMKVIDPVLVELQRRYAPLLYAVPSQRWPSTTYWWNQRTSVPAGGFVPDGGARPVTSSVYAQNSVNMAHVASIGAVTGYAEAVTQGLIGSLRRTEIMGATRGYWWDIETGLLWGNAASTLNAAQPQFDGLDTLVSNFAGADGYPNAIDFAGGSFSLGVMDKLIDRVQQNIKEPIENSGWMFMMSTTAKSKTDQILVGQQRFTQVEVAAGLIVSSYRNIPMVESSFLAAQSYQMGTVTAATASTGGSLPQSTTYRYQVSAVIARQGEVLPCAEVSQATASGTNTNAITLSFTPPAGIDSGAAQLYKVYRTSVTVGGTTSASTSGSEVFLGYVDATVGLMSDGSTPIVTTSIIDTGSALIPANGSTVPAVLPQQYYNSNLSMLPPSAGEESIYLISRNRQNVVRPYVRDCIPLDVYPTTQSPDSLPFALWGDTCLAVRSSRFVGRAARVAVSLTF